jgi:rhodanese-related sulfurtransferase
MTIDQLLADTRRRLQRLDPRAALDASRAGAVLIDIRTESQIARDGTIPGALVISRNVLEWRLDPASDRHDPRGPQLHDQVVVVCDEGYQSSLAAGTLQQLGFTGATDLAGGFQAWLAAGLPVQQPTQSGQPPQRFTTT